MRRLLGIDNGERRVGVAVYDDPELPARPLTTVPVAERDTAATVAAKLAALAKEHAAAGFVVGLPLRLDGREGTSSRKARALAAELKRASGLPVALHDERLTTAEAQAARHATGASGQASRAGIDEHAATIVLQSWVDARKSAAKAATKGDA